MQDRQQILRSNYEAVRERIHAAADVANRNVDEVTLVGVTKHADIETTRDFIAAGCMDLGESRPQVLWPKAEALADLPVRWHQIGHLQRNKLRKTQPLVSLIHSVDSIRLLQAIDTLQSELSADEPQDILLEVNASGDEAKHGFSASNVQMGVDAGAAVRPCATARTHVHGGTRHNTGPSSKRLRQVAQPPRNAPATLPGSRFRRTVDGHERRF